MPDTEPIQPGPDSFKVLVHHFFDRFFDNDTISTDADPRTTAIQVLALVTSPSMIIVMFLMEAYMPDFKGRLFWGKTADHYYFVLYSMVVTGGVTLLEWDMLFPDRIDYQVLSVLPISWNKLFRSKTAALG